MQEMLSYEEFKEKIKEKVTERLDTSKRVVLTPVLKNNGTVYDGLIITEQCRNISPTIYLKPYYDKYLDDVPMDKIIEEIMKSYEEHLPTEDFDISLFKDWDKASKSIIMKLINTKQNEELLKSIPSVPFYDLSIIFCVAVCDFMNEYATITIHNGHLQLWGVEVEDLYRFAMENTPRLLPCLFENMEKMIPDLGNINFPLEMEMYLLTNKTKINGAISITYKDLLEEIAERLNDNFYIIPSSIHEVLIIPWKSVNEEYTFKDFTEMIEEVNETQLASDEVLSNHVYFYVKSDGCIYY